MSLKLVLARLLYWGKGLLEDPVDLFEALGVASRDRILEVGCAIGYHTLALAELAPDGKIYAVDVWEEGLAYLNSRIEAGQEIETIHGDAGAVELPAASLDKVICFDTLHDVPAPERAIEIWAELLEEGGKFAYRDPIIPPEKIEAYSGGKLRQEGTIKGVHIFIRH